MSNTIDREEMINAIEMVEKYGEDERGRIVPWNRTLVPYLRFGDVVMTIADMPSVQMKITRCRECRWYDITDPYGTIAPNAHRCKRVSRLWMEEDDFCSYGEGNNE